MKTVNNRKVFPIILVFIELNCRYRLKFFVNSKVKSSITKRNFHSFLDMKIVRLQIDKFLTCFM